MYTIIELQTSAQGTLSVLHTEKATWREAQKAYHEKMVYAAQSTTLACYSVVILDNRGNRVNPAPYFTSEEEPEAEA